MMPLAALADRRVRGEFKAWRDSFAATPRKADYARTTLARIMSFAKDRGTIATNPCEKGCRLYSADRTDKVWGEPEIAVVLSVASSDIKLALVLALWTGQRTFCDRHGRRTTEVTFGFGSRRLGDAW
jgi:hypothetical protein